ncbi:rubrerythrin family protein [Halobacterium wangiae]|uniref:rubrerythrin family protein n=1 Tax=Halobacterium wangiae TaxID=2902623 RepID=UPI001E59F2D8|nr:rubrerythrin family protein [Halobacterium wangiae]
MDADNFRDSVEAANATQLDRLGSSKRLVAITGADLSEETVLRAAAASEAAATEVFEAWAADSDGDAAETFESFAAHERDHYDRVTAELGDEVAAESGAVHDYLREQDDAVSRAGATVGRGLVATRTLTQFVGYFVNAADEARADLFRELKRETSEDTDAAVELLAATCESDEDWERAEAAATGAVDAAYEEYVAALEGMGVNAKSVC